MIVMTNNNISDDCREVAKKLAVEYLKVLESEKSARNAKKNKVLFDVDLNDLLSDGPAYQQVDMDGEFPTKS